MIVLDACVLIAFLDANDSHHSRARTAMERTAGRARGASAVTIAEILVGPGRTGQLDDAEALLTLLGIRQVPLGSDAPPRLARLRAESGLKLPDCCVLLAAQDSAAEAVATFDDRLIKAAQDLGLEVVER